MKRVLLTLSKANVLAALLAAMLLASCAPAKITLVDDILGTWKNNEGYTIQFKDGGTGFIPGVPGKIADSSFTYTVTDNSHINIDVGGHIQTIEIHISGDQLTWKDDLGEVAYTRVK